MKNPQKHLAIAVIARAFLDLEPSRSTRESESYQSRLFLTGTSRHWRESRGHWCDIAEICPERARNAALGILKSVAANNNDDVKFMRELIKTAKGGKRRAGRRKQRQKKEISQ